MDRKDRISAPCVGCPWNMSEARLDQFIAYMVMVNDAEQYRS